MTAIKVISPAKLEQLTRSATDSPRLRTHHNFHQDHDETVQRMCIALQPGTYVRPHQHCQPGKWELLGILSGRVLVLLFDEEGVVSQRLVLAADGDAMVVEIPPVSTHSIVAFDGSATLMEVKEGPYMPATAADFAAWAPAENDSERVVFLDWAAHAQPGDRWKFHVY